MQTYWVRVYMDPDESINLWDAWCTGHSEDKKIVCFALRADSAKDLFDFIADHIVEDHKVDFLEERDWKTYRDFAGGNTRFPMAENFLDDEIDHISKFNN